MPITWEIIEVQSPHQAEWVNPSQSKASWSTTREARPHPAAGVPILADGVTAQLPDPPARPALSLTRSDGSFHDGPDAGFLPDRHPGPAGIGR